MVKKKALVLGTYVNAPYHPFQQVDRVLFDLLAPDFEVTLTDDLRLVPSMNRQGYTLLISYLDAFDSKLPDDCAEEILSFVRNGGGLLCLHNGISLQTDDRMFHLIGGKFVRHPPQVHLQFTPAPEGFLRNTSGFSIQEEPYQFEMSGETVTPLLRYTYDGKPCLGGWCRSEEKGRIVFLTPGHSIQTFCVPAYISMIEQSIKWLQS